MFLSIGLKINKTHSLKSHASCLFQIAKEKFTHTQSNNRAMKALSFKFSSFLSLYHLILIRISRIVPNAEQN